MIRKARFEVRIMDLSSQKRMAAKILKCGISRVRIDAATEDAKKGVEEALTREDIRALIRGGIIVKVQKKGSSGAHSRKNLMQKKRGRRGGTGSRRGKKRHGTSKAAWVKLVKSLRRLIREMRDSGQIERRDYRMLYLRVKGGFFRSKNHLLHYLKEHEMLKKTERGQRQKAGEKAVKKPKSSVRSGLDAKRKNV